MANKQRKKQKKAAQQAANVQSAQWRPTNQAGQVIEFELGGDLSPQPFRQARRTPRQPVVVYCKESLIAKFSEAGYHRARVTCISPYDRIIGGIVWAMYMFDSSPRGKKWYFVESAPGATKSDRDRARECAQILVVKEDIAYRQPISSKDLLEVNATVLGPYVDFLLSEISNDNLHIEKFDMFRNYFNATFETKEAAIHVFLETLHRPNDNQNCDMDDFNKFDYSILRDEYVTGKIMLYEYVNYNRTGKRTYPGIFDAYGTGKFAEKRGPEDIKLRAQMDSLADETVMGVDEDTHYNIRYMANMIDHLRFGYKIINIECRFLEEASAYFKMNQQYREFAKAFAFLGDTVDEIHPLNSHAMQKVIDTVLQRWAKLEKAQLVELTERQKRLYNLRRNHDEYDPEVYWDPDNCEKANQMEKENAKFEKYIANSKAYPNDMLTVHYAFQSFCEVRHSSRPKEEEGNNFGLIPHVDETIVDDITDMINSLADVIDDMESLDTVEDIHDVDHRRAVTSYLADCKNLLADWYWKAKIIMDARMALCARFKALKLQTKLYHHKLFYAEKEASLLMRLNQLVRDNEKELKKREKLVHIFNIDWNKKKERKATREAAIAAAKELKRQHALEAARAAKQAKHAKNGKKGASGKKGRHGARR